MLLLQANVHATIPGDPCARDRLVVTTAASRWADSRRRV